MASSVAKAQRAKMKAKKDTEPQAKHRAKVEELILKWFSDYGPGLSEAKEVEPYGNLRSWLSQVLIAVDDQGY